MEQVNKIPDVAAKALHYMEANKVTKEAFSKKIDFARPTLSQYLDGKYTSNPENIEKAIIDYLKSEGQWEEQTTAAAPETVQAQKLPARRNSFLASMDARETLARCQSCQEEKGLGLIIGRPGRGKTYMLKHYARAARVCYIECNNTMTKRDLVKAIERVLGLPKGRGTIDDRMDLIKEFFMINSGYLLIFDEADKMFSRETDPALDTIRSLFDTGNVGILVAGEPRLESLIKNYMPMFANRIEFYQELDGLTADEVEEYLEDYHFSKEAMQEMIYRGTNSHTGCFRLLDRTLKNIKRLVRQDEEITQDIINKASRMMLL